MNKHGRSVPVPYRERALSQPPAGDVAATLAQAASAAGPEAST
jgi:hypothetical protein